MDSVADRSTRRAVFLDRDGTINVDDGYVYRVADFALIPGAADAIRRLNEAQVPVVVVTNQGGIGLGLYSEEDVEVLHQHLQGILQDHGAHVDAFYYCPEHPRATNPRYYHADSPCRKPNTGMLDEALSRFALRGSDCFLVGDKESDIVAGQRCRMTTILVRTGCGSDYADTTAADFVDDDLARAVDRIFDAWNTTR